MPRSSHRQEAARVSPGTVRLSKASRSILESVRDHQDPNPTPPPDDWQRRSCLAFSLRFSGLLSIDVDPLAGDLLERQAACAGRWRLTPAGRAPGKRLRKFNEQVRGTPL